MIPDVVSTQNKTLFLESDPLSLKNEGIVGLFFKTIKTISLDIPCTLFEKIPNAFLKQICYNLWVTIPLILYIAPMLLYAVFWKQETGDEFFFKLLLPKNCSRSKIENDTKYSYSTKTNKYCTIHSIKKSTSNKKNTKSTSNKKNTIVWFPGRGLTYKKDKDDLKKILDKQATPTEIKYIELNCLTDKTLDPSATYIQQATSALSEELKDLKDPNTQVTLYGYSFGGHLMTNLLLTEPEMPQGCTIILDRSFESFSRLLNEILERCILLKWFIKNYNQDFSPEAFALDTIDQIVSKRDIKTTVYIGQQDYKVKFVHAQNCANIKTTLVSTALNRFSKIELTCHLILILINFILFNTIIFIISLFLTAMYFTKQNPFFFDTHAAPYIATQIQLQEREIGNK